MAGGAGGPYDGGGVDELAPWKDGGSGAGGLGGADAWLSDSGDDAYSGPACAAGSVKPLGALGGSGIDGGGGGGGGASDGARSGQAGMLGDEDWGGGASAGGCGGCGA